MPFEPHQIWGASMFNFCPILFNIYLCDIFFMTDTINIANYADDNTPYSVGKNLCELETKLQKVSVKRFKWFLKKSMKAVQNKCNILSSLDISIKFLLPTCIPEISYSRNLLGVTIDRKLNVKEHVTNLRDKVSKKI